MLAASTRVESRSPGSRRVAGRKALFLLAWFIAVIMAAFWIAWVAILAGVWEVDFYPKLDFFTFYAASSLAVDGVAATAYEAEAIWRAEAQLPGDDGGFLAWLNPPTFFFVVLPLSLLPLAAAFVAWLVLTGAFAFSAVYRIAEDKPVTLLLAAIFPASLANLLIGHNAYLMAGAFAWGMLLLDRRPVVAGAALSLLAFKPQFFPLVLVALVSGRHYRAAASALTCVTLLCLASVPAFGLQSWTAFVEIGQLYASRLYDGTLDLRELHSVSAVLLLAGVPELPARAVQLALAAACAAFVWWLWRRDTLFEYKAAGLAIATVLATPYSYVYDLTLMGVAMLWLASAFQREGWRRADVVVLVAAWPLQAAYAFVGFSLTPVALFTLAYVVLRRVATSQHDQELAKVSIPATAQ